MESSSLQLHCINSITLLTPPLPLSLLSQSIHPPGFFFLRCPNLIFPFYLPPVFAAISPLPRLSLILVSPGFLSPGEGGRREGLSQEVTGVQLTLTSHLVCNTHQHFSEAYLSITGVSPLRHMIHARNASDSIPHMEIIPEGVTCFSPTRSTRRSYTARQGPCGVHLMTPYMCHQLKLCVTLRASSRVSERPLVM